ncbi:S8 family serine peptidase [Photobacterium minamisatsumaniensis]|uniref:S8 family serine peptidase n=1 Tax=Photobacterium minamisatsumaniensis TaxID=2910233 RepID=UPI003D0EBC04
MIKYSIPLLLFSLNTVAGDIISGVDLEDFNGQKIKLIYKTYGEPIVLPASINSYNFEPLFLSSIQANSTIVSNDKYGLDDYYFFESESVDDIKSAYLALSSMTEVKSVYIEPLALPLSLPNTNPPPPSSRLLVDDQLYLNSPEGNGNLFGGVNAKYAWSLPGGKGHEVDIISSEGGSYFFNHEDLPYPFIIIGDESFNSGWGDHTTQSVGVMSSIDNAYGTTGIANAARVGWVKYGAENLLEAVNNLEKGSVIQVGVQYGVKFGSYCSNGCLLPVDWADAVYDVIRYATEERGIHIIQAAGNGNKNLDHYEFENKFNRELRDSGAIMVAASDETGRRASFTNYGSRIDSFSWGMDVTTTSGGSNNNSSFYTHYFSGTSSANPIVTGAVAGIQSTAIAAGLGPIKPYTLRDIITKTGTPTPYPEPNRYIATQPDMKKAINTIMDSHETKAIAGSDITSLVNNEARYNLDGTNSISAQGQLSYTWKLKKAEGLESSDIILKQKKNASAYFTIREGASYEVNNIKLTFKLTVKDEVGNESTDTMKYTLSRASGDNEKPNVIIHTQGSYLGTSILVDGSASSGNNEIAKFKWVVKGPDGNVQEVDNKNLAVTSFVPREAGEYTIKLRVVDSLGVSKSKKITLLVSEKTGESNNDEFDFAYPDGIGNYVSGTTVSVTGTTDDGIYECSISGWCNQNNWAYKPGDGLYWSSAWNKIQ